MALVCKEISLALLAVCRLADPSRDAMSARSLWLLKYLEALTCCVSISKKTLTAKVFGDEI